MRKQNGLSLVSLLFVCVAVGLIMVLGFKLVPTFSEYFAVKNTLRSLVNDKAGAPPSEIREAFLKHAEVEGIKTVHQEDLDIVEDKSGTSISVAYQAKVALFANVSLVFDFNLDAHHSDASQ